MMQRIYRFMKKKKTKPASAKNASLKGSYRIKSGDSVGLLFLDRALNAQKWPLKREKVSFNGLLHW